MRTLEHARARGREYRALLGPDPEGLCDRIERYLLGTWNIETVAVGPAQMEGSVGEIAPLCGVLTYADTLSPADKVTLFAHELGHLVLHKRLTDPTLPRDPVLGSAYADAGPGAIARYSPRALEEAQASAFAAEFLCPSGELFAAWRDDPMATAQLLAVRFEVPREVVRAQLAQALLDTAIGADTVAAAPREVRCTDRQLEAARFTGKPALIDAGPGTGKTATLIRRVQFLLGEHAPKARPEQLLVMTFSNEAAQELRDRLAGTVGVEAAEAMTVATFHGFGMTFLHHHGHHLGYGTDFSLLDEDAQEELVTSVLGRVPCGRLLMLRDPTETVERVVQHINYCKNRLLRPDALASALETWTPEPDETSARAAAGEFLGVYRAYEAAKVLAKRIDFADLIMMPLSVLEQQPEVAAAYRAKYPWMLVDEFQDVTRATSRLLAHLCGPDNPPWVVGDARQAIYRFLDADPENVRAFTKDFPGAVVFELDVNYRSSGPVIRAANELATLLASPDGLPVELRERWQPGANHLPFGSQPIAIAEAASDYAESEGVADQVKAWLGAGEVVPGDIAILARRNLDVRNIVLALAARGVRAQASGLLSAEGAAGDLAAVVTLIDAPIASLPRVAIALARGLLPRDLVNEVIRHLVSPPGTEAGVTSVAAGDGAEMAQEIARVRESLAQERPTADGFAILTAFLFETGGYLRRLLAAADSAERSMALVEIASALSLAVSYRVTHPDTPPQAARIGFAERLRNRLTETAPIPIVPRARSDAVRVMTCHASKGLEFPCVIVAGQTVPIWREKYPWLPPSWRPAADEDAEQGDALLFVGVTRAQRAVVVSYPKQAGEGPRGRPKEVVRLLARWRAAYRGDVFLWTASGGAAAEVTMATIWGGEPPATLRLSALDSGSCPIRTYLEGFLTVRFPSTARPLYPAFFAITRRVLRRLIRLANDTGRPVSDAEVLAIADEEWPESDFADHPLVAIYRSALLRFALALAHAYRPAMGPITPLDPELAIAGGGDDGPLVRLDLIGHFLLSDGRVVALGFRPESLKAKAQGGELNWSKAVGTKRAAFVLLEHRASGIRPALFSGEDGEFFDFRWSTRKDSLSAEAAKLLGQLDALRCGEFGTKISPYHCDRCPVRVSCPYWAGALS